MPIYANNILSERLMGLLSSLHTRTTGREVLNYRHYLQGKYAVSAHEK
jgi:hypothetical protein